MKDNYLKLKGYILVNWIIRLVLGMTFIFASWHKIVNPGEFAKILYGYGVFPGISINFIAIFLPYIELFAGICLVSGILPRPSLLVINGLLTGFIILITFNLLRGHTFDCGCFSISKNPGNSSVWMLLIRDCLMLWAGVYLWKRFGKPNKQMPGYLTSPDI
ncbi:MAG: DoxX family membrane protein [Desulfobacteraceae bacterium]|nr:DoxX family membrane protein [Desulfobacteraceae bacterium]